MNISNKVLEQSLIDSGYSVEEYPTENKVALKFRGSIIKTWCAIDEQIKAKYINGFALRDNYSRNQYIESCQAAIESGGAWNNG